MSEVMGTGAKTSWLFWVVVAIAILWNGFGGYDYTMSHVSGDAYFRQSGMTAAKIAEYHAYPSWLHAVWAIGVWGSVVGTILLVLRSRWAFHAFAVSSLGAVGALVHTIAGGAAAGDLVLPLVVVVICAFFVWFSQTMTKRGVLR